LRVPVLFLVEPAPADHFVEPGLKGDLFALLLLQLGDVVVEEVKDLIVARYRCRRPSAARRVTSLLLN
jgi:hypothetical protein